MLKNYFLPIILKGACFNIQVVIYWGNSDNSYLAEVPRNGVSDEGFLIELDLYDCDNNQTTITGYVYVKVDLPAATDVVFDTSCVDEKIAHRNNGAAHYLFGYPTDCYIYVTVGFDGKLKYSCFANTRFIKHKQKRGTLSN